MVEKTTPEVGTMAPISEKTATGGAGTITPSGPPPTVEFEPQEVRADGSYDVTRVYANAPARAHIGTITVRGAEATFMPVTYNFISLKDLKAIVARMENK